MELDRRHFLKGAGAAAGMAALAGMAGTAMADEAAESAAAEGTTAAAGDLMTADKAAEVKWSFEVAPDPIPEDQIVETYTHDIVVVAPAWVA